jgi:iron complex outermembrane recepter protein
MRRTGGPVRHTPDRRVRTRTYPGCTHPTVCSRIVEPITTNNAAEAGNDYNGVDTYGGRAALRVSLDNSWTVTPSVTSQETCYGGVPAYDPAVGPLELAHFIPERYFDMAEPRISATGRQSDSCTSES